MKIGTNDTPPSQKSNFLTCVLVLVVFSSDNDVSWLDKEDGRKSEWKENLFLKKTDK